MDTEEDIRYLIDMYYTEKEKYLVLGRNVPQYMEQTKMLLAGNPEAQEFLDDQVNYWHPASLYELYRHQIAGTHFGNARHFLKILRPENDKQRELADDLEEWYEKARGVHVGVNAACRLIKKEQTLPIIDSSESHQPPSKTWLETSASDESFLKTYKAMAAINWKTYAGLWSFRVKPVEGKESRSFYTSVSDFALCMVDGIEELEKKLIQTRALKLN
jgi:hypothetical protein